MFHFYTPRKHQKISSVLLEIIKNPFSRTQTEYGDIDTAYLSVFSPNAGKMFSDDFRGNRRGFLMFSEEIKMEIGLEWVIKREY